MRKNMFSLILGAVCVLTVLGGCTRLEQEIDTTKSSKHYLSTLTIYYDKELADTSTSDDVNSASANASADAAAAAAAQSMDSSDFQNLPVVTINKTQYYKDSDKTTKKAYSPRKPVDGQIVTKDSFYAANGTKIFEDKDASSDPYEAIDSGMTEQMSIIVHFKNKVKKTNGTLSNKGKTVTFRIGAKKLENATKIDKKNPMGEIYAYTDASENTLETDRKIAKKYAKK